MVGKILVQSDLIDIFSQLCLLILIILNISFTKVTFNSDHSVWLLIIGAVFMTFGYESPPLPPNIKADPKRAKRHDLAPVTLIGLPAIFFVASCYVIDKIKSKKPIEAKKPKVD